ncbi:MAG: cytochrome oxidase subunit III [Azospira oryzae]|jgi:cytochrome c oxidase subunit 3|nr:MAG: cytochrome oxidase subunit III [Azospira oryzae]
MENITTSEFKIIEEPKKQLSMNPKKFAMWLFIASVLMLFAAFTSAYIVRRAEGNWLYFELPDLFYYSTVIILLSSVTMQWAFFAARKDNLEMVKVGVGVTALLGVAFVIVQFLGWGQMADQGVYLVGNPSGSFVILLTLVHGVHLLSAIIFVLIVLNASFKLKIHSKSMSQIEMCTTYWHFLGGLWLYLFVFLLLNR